MEFISVFDKRFAPYGRVIEGYDTAALLAALKKTELPEGVAYVPRVQSLHDAAGAEDIMTAIYGGMPFEIGYCNGHNTKLNCLEYHRDSEINLGTEDFILLIAKQGEVEDGVLDTEKVKAFKVPAGVMVEVYATTLHYAPCHADPAKGFQVMVVLPDGTNTDYRPGCKANVMDSQLWARNKWLIAHPESDEAKQGAYVGLKGVNTDIAADL